MKSHVHVSDVLYFYPSTVPDRDCFATGQSGPHIIYPSPIVRHGARRAAVGNPNIILIAARLHYKRTVQVTTRYSNIPYHSFTRYVKLAWWRKLRQGGLFAKGGLGRDGWSMRVRRRGADCDGGGPLPKPA